MWLELKPEAHVNIAPCGYRTRKGDDAIFSQTNWVDRFILVSKTSPGLSTSRVGIQ